MSYRNVRLTRLGCIELAEEMVRNARDPRHVDLPAWFTEIEAEMQETGNDVHDTYVTAINPMGPRVELLNHRDYTVTWTIDADDVLVCSCGHVYLPDWQCTMAETRDAPAEYEAQCPQCHASADEAEPLSDCTATITADDCESDDLWEFVNYYRSEV